MMIEYRIRPLNVIFVLFISLAMVYFLNRSSLQTNLRINECVNNLQCHLAECDCVEDIVQNINKELYPQLRILLKKSFFRYYKINLHQPCPFWTENGLCFIKHCNVEECDLNSLPPFFYKNKDLGDINLESSKDIKNLGKLFNICLDPREDDTNFCKVDDEQSSDTVYVNLLDNVERYTGFVGPSSTKIWDSIYQENCFSMNDKIKDEEVTTTLWNFLDVAKKNGVEDVCLEKKVFYKLMSGLHSSISAHIARKYLDRKTDTWGPNRAIYQEKLGNLPERKRNLNFLYLFVLRAVSKISPYWKDYNFCTGDPIEDSTIEEEVKLLSTLAVSSPQYYYESVMFQRNDPMSAQTMTALKQEYRSHFRNISLIMDCVACEKCRLWGKLQTTGIGTALKIMFSYGDKERHAEFDGYNLKRSEIVALLNTLGQLSESIDTVHYFETIKNHEIKLMIRRWLSIIVCLTILAWLILMRRKRQIVPATATFNRLSKAPIGTK